MSKRRSAQKDTETDDSNKSCEWPGRQVPTTQLSLFQTNFVRKASVTLATDSEAFEERFVIQTTLDRYVERRSFPG